ncbi:hypothetical protein HS088_TW11G00535 [Tripterygium wilfordii]|uniref:Uncharacterized protein n=1 Tax=Tripterygium wilfordii TaxID=458696 RepID=A0A7J7D319_TRIWF|nr:UPF0481 protein At3g47200-like [Tripterygium wilfordii]KAF5740466.1 hypothetical protein HS088_TW11G00535 [Tripterygium wilfordii]
MEPHSNSLEHLVIEFFTQIFSLTQPPTIESYKGKNHILDLLREWLVSSLPTTELCKKTEGIVDRQGNNHILDLLRKWLVSWLPRTELCKKTEGIVERQGWKPMPSVKSLEEAGIKFEKGKSECILDIKFKNGILEVPSILIQEITEDVFRNLISFEQCYSKCPAIVTSYAVLLDSLINTETDMNLLCEKGIIDNWLNPEDATQFFNKLYHDTYVKKYYYLELCKEVNDYCRYPWPRWRAAYLRNYFGTPWAIASQVVAAIVLILTILQTVFSVLK